MNVRVKFRNHETPKNCNFVIILITSDRYVEMETALISLPGIVGLPEIHAFEIENCLSYPGYQKFLLARVWCPGYVCLSDRSNLASKGN